jgi:hypothetical protein
VADPAYPIFVATDATALEGGFIYMGQAYQDPEQAPIAVFWDDALTIPAAQPLRTSGGVIVRDGTPSEVFSASETYSIRVRDRSGAVVWYKSIAGGALLSRRVTFPIPTGPASDVPGPADNTYGDLASFKASDTQRASARLVGVPGVADGNFNWTVGDFTGKADDQSVIKADSTPLSAGAWVRQGASGVTYARLDTGAKLRTATDAIADQPRSPADFGGIQAALDKASAAAFAGSLSHAPVALEQDKAYTLTSGLTLNTMRTSLQGYSTVNVPASVTTGVTVDCTQDGDLNPQPQSYGYKGLWWGNTRFVGAGSTVGQTGIDFNGTTTAGSAQIGAIGLVSAKFKYGLKFSNHGYNSTFLRAELFNNEYCIYWPGGGTDNNERNTFISCTLYNSDHAMYLGQSDSSLFMYGGSIDYTHTVVRVNTAKAFLTDVHQESRDWTAYPYEAYGDGGYIRISGGGIWQTLPQRPYPYMAYVDKFSRMDVDGTFLHNLALTRETPDTPTAFFNGPGSGYIRNTHGFTETPRPDRLHASYTQLLDPSYEDAAWLDLIWVAEDTAPITSRQTGTNLTITKTTQGRRSGTKALLATKAQGAGTSASFGFIFLPMRPGEKAFAGTHMASGSGTISVSIQWLWGKLDRFDANGLPIWFGLSDALGGQFSGAGEPFEATETWRIAVFGKVADADSGRLGLTDITIPPGYTHLVGQVRMFDAPAGAQLKLDDSWQDTW